MKKKVLLSLFVVLVLVVMVTSVVWASDKSASAPGQMKNGSGCIGCHVGVVTLPDGTKFDVSLSGEVNRALPNHVKLEAGTTINECMKCHEKQGVMNKFKDKLHDVHWNSEILGVEFNAPKVTDRCTFCHNMGYIRGYNDSANGY